MLDESAPVKRIKAAIRDVPDFPKPGIVFKDITPVLADARLFAEAIDLFADRHVGAHIDKVAVIDARGFIFGSALAYRLGAGLVPIRKKGKLPYNTFEEAYALEYGTASLSVHTDAFRRGDRVLLVDDLLATGGTAAAAARLVERGGGQLLEMDFLVELTFLNGRARLGNYPVFAPCRF